MSRTSEFLRLLSAAMPPDQFIKDEPTFDRNLKELESANSPSIETRREWIQSLPAERKAELADRTRAFNDLEPASEEREHMRKVMDDIREATKTRPICKKRWLPTGNGCRGIRAASRNFCHEQLHDLPVEKQVAVVQKTYRARGEASGSAT